MRQVQPAPAGIVKFRLRSVCGIPEVKAPVAVEWDFAGRALPGTLSDSLGERLASMRQRQGSPTNRRRLKQMAARQ